MKRPRRLAVAVPALFLCAGLAATPAPAVRAHRQLLLGRSLGGRPIQAVEVGDPAGRKVLVVGCVHGTEPAGIAVARRVARLAPRGIDLWIVPDLNPDGNAAHTRGNAHGVDLNRNFPYRWRRLRGVYDSGPRPLSERESWIAYRLILRLRPSVTIWFHQHLDLVWASGGDRAVEKRFARVSGLPYRSLPALPGSAIDWQNHRLAGTTAFAAELPAGEPSRAAVERYARAVLASARVK
jgi:murein peptide amidase A